MNYLSSLNITFGVNKNFHEDDTRLSISDPIIRNLEIKFFNLCNLPTHWFETNQLPVNKNYQHYEVLNK